ncbi:YdjY domain-containing protein [Enterococcus hirae]|nr:YdjY domain-containing protein [Enterococcus hirae]
MKVSKGVFTLVALASIGILAACGNSKKENAASSSAKASSSQVVKSSTTSSSSAAKKVSEKDPFYIDKEKKEIHFLARVNGTYLTEKTIHGISYKDANNGTKSILASYMPVKDYYNALESFSLKPGNNLTKDSEKGSLIEGDKLKVNVIIDGKEYPIEKTVKINGENPAPLDFRFGGNLETNEKSNAGCLLCYNSCPTGVSSARDYGYKEGPIANGDSSVLPADGKFVEVVVSPVEG